ncbi:MAG: hypothetical protein CM15mP117_08570 [Alphaproteobacteria bacterium]|nr:MAG: hypothetical protein CM15mP117_08570 [Alphaproteobacteria bacterium]
MAACVSQKTRSKYEQTLQALLHHDEIQPLEPQKIYELDIEIWPTSIVIPKNYRIALTVRGKRLCKSI